MISHSETIAVPIEKVWEHFLFKIENPVHFVPGITHVQILEKTVGYTVRSMDLTLPDGSAATVVEKITAKPYLVTYMILDHPTYEGVVENLAEKISDHKTKITYTMRWNSKQTNEPMLNKDLIKGAVLKTVAYIMKDQD